MLGSIVNRGSITAGGEAAVEGEESPLLKGVHFCALDGRDMGVLWDVQPAFVIMYDPDIAFVRQLEVGFKPPPLHPAWYLDCLQAFRHDMSSTAGKAMHGAISTFQRFRILLFSWREMVTINCDARCC